MKVGRTNKDQQQGNKNVGGGSKRIPVGEPRRVKARTGEELEGC